MGLFVKRYIINNLLIELMNFINKKMNL